AYAVHLQKNEVGVPVPVAYNEIWAGRRLLDSFFLSDYLHDVSDFNSEMAFLFREDPDMEKFLDLLRLVATEVRRMHDSGFVHQDLGGQNILLQRSGSSWGRPMFIDLNRGRILPEVSLRQRARDLAKLDIPWRLRQIFFHIYFGDREIPEEFSTAERLHRLRITLHNESRKYRHPIRHLVHSRRYIVPSTTLPKPRDMWLWDDRSLQPAVILGRSERLRLRDPLDSLRIIGSQFLRLPSIVRGYRAVMDGVYRQKVAMRDRAGLCVEAGSGDLPLMLEQLEGLGGIPILVRCYAHRGEQGLRECADAVDKLAQLGHEVSLGIVQSRRSVVAPGEWTAFLEQVFASFHNRVRFIEVGHAINRVKWGVWSFSEAAALFESVAGLRARYPAVKVLGPGVIDFEFHYFQPLLSRMRGCFDGISSHLYVDRRGAPESPQGPFSLLEKCAMGRAIAGVFGIPGFYVTETNWPLKETKDYSPVQGHYSYAGQKESHVAVDEATYAAYMVRYLLVSICSGCCERVWWWNLASRGFGLVDDRDGWRKRPAWHALAFFHKMLGQAVFERHEEREGASWFYFDRCTVVYAQSPCEVAVPGDSVQCFGIDGDRRAPDRPGRIQVSGDPLYLVTEPEVVEAAANCAAIR
ncbi:MAG TPA: lipopolysaccharide kinase InaA family protein, partial [Opitutaceae bacterium]|nr:lipopolysaccharide kinase InaA family protein [Opitutaceae bacterium]